MARTRIPAPRKQTKADADAEALDKALDKAGYGGSPNAAPRDTMIITRGQKSLAPLTPEQTAKIRRDQAIRKYPTTSI